MTEPDVVEVTVHVAAQPETVFSYFTDPGPAGTSISSGWPSAAPVVIAGPIPTPERDSRTRLRGAAVGAEPVDLVRAAQH